MKLAMSFILNTRNIFTKLLGISESSIQEDVMLHEIIFDASLTSAVTCKQILLHGSKIVQYLQNSKFYNVTK